MTLYMHTLDGKPAQFYDKYGICFNRRLVVPVRTLRQIRREQELSMESDQVRGRHGFTYGYVTIKEET